MRIQSRWFFLVFCLALSSIMHGQEHKLANQYFNEGEYEKAAAVYQKLYKKTNNNEYYFTRYLDCLSNLDEYAKGEAEIRNQLKARPKDSQLYVMLGDFLEKQTKDEEAKLQYKTAISLLPDNQNTIQRTANAFMRSTKFDLAIETYLSGVEKLNNEQVFSYSLATLYQRKGEVEDMIKWYLIALKQSPERLANIKMQFQRYLGDEDYEELQVQLYALIQEDSEFPMYPELLEWVFIQQKDYKNALRQSRALDRRLAETGMRVFNIGQISENAGEYETALDAYNYIIENHDIQNPYYLLSKNNALQVKRKMIVAEGASLNKAAFLELEKDYESFLDEIGRDRRTAEIIKEHAELEAFYLNNLDKGISILEGLLQIPSLNKYTEANSKLLLGDFYLIQGEIWDATLLYSQVDKDFMEDLLGERARFKNAKLSYFNGEFEWAQIQFDALKASTSKLISNDAMDLSVFIMDNLGLDSTDEAMRLYASAELYSFQNKHEEAFASLETLEMKFTDHTLIDDIKYLKADIYNAKGEFEKAAALYSDILENHKEEIRADNALFKLARLYETVLADKTKAMELYETLFVDFSNSTFAVESRKRFRYLRGDKLSKEELFMMGIKL